MQLRKMKGRMSIMMLAFLLAGCAIRPVFGPAQISLEVLGRNVVHYSQQDPLVGEVVYQGIEGVITEARIFLDGQYIITLEAKGSEVRLQPVEVGNYGWHTIHGDVVEVRKGKGVIVRKRVLCFRHDFPVSIKYRNASYYWWRVDIHPYDCY